AGSLGGRSRRARGVERLQLRWLARAAVLVVLAGVVVLAALALGVPGAATLLTWALGGSLAVLPIATGAAILPYPLYDLDRVTPRTPRHSARPLPLLRARFYALDRTASRTLAYGLLPVLLGLGYAVVPLGLGGLLGRDSSLSVDAATLCVAIRFRP